MGLFQRLSFKGSVLRTHFSLFLSKEKESYFCAVYVLAAVPRGLKFSISKALFSESFSFRYFFFKDKKLVPYGSLEKFSKIIRGQLLEGLPEACITHFPASGLRLCRQKGALAVTSAGSGRLRLLTSFPHPGAPLYSRSASGCAQAQLSL